ncbi:MAG: hydrogenase maturation nickel metallochaperone HypA [Verrucomicrobiota bacterium]
MHEFSICEGLVGAVLEEMSRHGAPAGSLRRARVVVGGMHQILPENLTTAYEVLTRDTVAAGSELELRVLPITARCRPCGWTGEIRQPLFLCGTCNSGDIELVTGRELYLENLEIETP